MKDKYFIRRVGEILVSCDKLNFNDKKTILKLMELYTKYISDIIKMDSKE